ncbi:MAG: hypothetical protein AB1405_04870 [Bdellovibrionota bacterium]
MGRPGLSRFFTASALALFLVFLGSCTARDQCVQKCMTDPACGDSLVQERLIGKDAERTESLCDGACKGLRMSERGEKQKSVCLQK